MRYTNILKNITLISAITLITWACNPRKKVDRYSYLVKKEKPTDSSNDPTPTTKPEPDHRAPDAVFPKTPAGNIRKVIAQANSYLETPYKYGGMDRKGIDCSGLTTRAYASIEVKLPRSAADQAQYGKKVKRSAVQPGDLVCFSAYNKQKIDHVGLVVKVDGKKVTFIHASVSGGVRHDRMDTGYWAPRFREARRPVVIP